MGNVITLDRLQGPEISPSRLQDNVGKSLARVGAIAVGGQLVTGISVSAPSILPATFSVQNPLGKTAQGAFAVMKSQPCDVHFLSSTADALLFSLSLVPKSQNGVIFGLSPITGALTLAFWVF
jgi:hypothetical protein